MNKSFIRVPRPINEPGKGSYWQVDYRAAEAEMRSKAAMNIRSRINRSGSDPANTYRSDSGMNWTSFNNNGTLQRYSRDTRSLSMDSNARILQQQSLSASNSSSSLYSSNSTSSSYYSAYMRSNNQRHSGDFSRNGHYLSPSGSYEIYNMEQNPTYPSTISNHHQYHEHNHSHPNSNSQHFHHRYSSQPTASISMNSVYDHNNNNYGMYPSNSNNPPSGFAYSASGSLLTPSRNSNNSTSAPIDDEGHDSTSFSATQLYSRKMKTPEGSPSPPQSALDEPSISKPIRARGDNSDYDWIS